MHLSDDEDVEKPSSTEPQTPPRRKRPGASEAEKKWRAQNWRPKPELLANGHTNENDTVLIKDTVFQSMLEELDEAEVAAMAHSAATGPKFKPRANVVRLKDRGATPDLDHTNDSMVVDSADEHDYVYDTYILQEAMDIDLSTADPSNVGILVIAEEHKAIWETYLDEPESDEEQRSDDEDSNAEDHYGADYPEDELDFEDEHDIDAYRYRRNASDDEQYGYGSDDDYAAHSDDEGADADFHPFRRH